MDEPDPDRDGTLTRGDTVLTLDLVSTDPKKDAWESSLSLS